MNVGEGASASAPARTTGDDARHDDRRLWSLLVAGTLGRMPTATLPIAALLLVADRTDLTRGGLASGMVSLGAGGVGLALGRHLDGRRAARVLVVLAALHAPAVALFVAVASTRNTPLLVLASLLAGLTVPPVGPVIRALIADAAGPGQLQRVFALDSMSVEATWIGGPLLMSAAVALQGPALAVALSPAMAAVGAVAVARQPARVGAAVATRERWLNPSVIRLIGAFALTGTAFRALAIAVTEVARRQGHDELSGALLGVWAFGSLVGGWLVSRRRMPALHLLGAYLAVTVGLIGVGTSSIAITAVLVLVSGGPTAPYVASLNALISRVTVPVAHARAFAAAQAANTLMAAGSAAVGGWAIDRWGPAAVTVPAAVLVLGSMLLALGARPQGQG